MSYEVILLRQAEVDLNQNALWWSEHRSIEQALRWLDGFTAAIEMLSINPQRHSLAREDTLFSFPLRQLNFGISSKPTHRALFSVEGNRVLVYTVRHLSQNELSTDDVAK